MNTPKSNGTISQSKTSYALGTLFYTVLTVAFVNSTILNVKSILASRKDEEQPQPQQIDTEVQNG